MNILFLFAHPDDEAYGPAGAIYKYAQDPNNRVCVVCLSQGNRPGAEKVAKARQDAFAKSCTTLGAEYLVYDGNDCNLDYNLTIKNIEITLKAVEPDIVYTHNISDLHKDHRIVAEAAMVACRPKVGSTVKKLYMCEIPSSTDWTFGEIDPIFTPNTYLDVSSTIHKKIQVMSFYSTELYAYPDARSVESMECLAMYRGKQVGVHRAEAFKLIFDIS